jgi:lipoprotein-anchoring transpeptidase ErfK/SrfK
MHRHLLAVAGAASLLLAATSAPLRAYEYQQIFGQPLAGTEPRAVAPRRELVAYNGRYAPGTIVISTEERRLYYILPGNQAVKYGIGVGRPGFEWGRHKEGCDIHGSNEPQTIGQAVSSGCIRMTNEDVVDLYDRVKVGTRVVVLR